jgi:hypothetical protein
MFTGSPMQNKQYDSHADDDDPYKNDSPENHGREIFIPNRKKYGGYKKE